MRVGVPDQSLIRAWAEPDLSQPAHHKCGNPFLASRIREHYSSQILLASLRFSDRSRFEPLKLIPNCSEPSRRVGASYYCSSVLPGCEEPSDNVKTAPKSIESNPQDPLRSSRDQAMPIAPAWSSGDMSSGPFFRPTICAKIFRKWKKRQVGPNRLRTGISAILEIIEVLEL
jgi:hypothetical protein